MIRFQTKATDLQTTNSVATRKSIFLTVTSLDASQFPHLVDKGFRFQCCFIRMIMMIQTLKYGLAPIPTVSGDRKTE